MGKMELCITIKYALNSKWLYDDLKRFGLNVIDAGTETYVHGKINMPSNELADIVDICATHGECEIDLKATNPS